MAERSSEVEMMRQKARECHSNAKEASTPEEQAHWLRMAQNFLSMADERDEKRGTT